MAGSQPVLPLPSFGDNFAQRQAQQQRLSMALTNSTLDRQLSALRDLPNITKIAGPEAADRYASLFANVPEGTEIVNTPYAQTLAGLNLAGLARRAAGGGGGGGRRGKEGHKGGMVIDMYDANGNVVTSMPAKPTDLQHLELQWANQQPGGYTRIRYSQPTGDYSDRNVTTPPPAAPTTPQAPAPGKSDTGNVAGNNVDGIVANPDGTFTGPNGVRYNADGSRAE